jgi:N-carbamoyl-L-amino-acid hydrolase
MFAVDEDQVLADLRALAGFGKMGTGVNRLFLTDPDVEARRWLLGRMKEAGLDAQIDGVGNVYGASPKAKKTVVIGSHTDTVPGGGWLDGAMGVIFGLGVARDWLRAHPDSPLGVDVFSFADEEGTFLACLGSRAFCNLVEQKDIDAATNASGIKLTDRLGELGISGRPAVQFDPDRHGAYLEAHIEQGPRLITDGVQIGAVTGIVGLRRHRIVFKGQADHAGTTPMAMRKDAGFALFGFATRLAELFKKIGGAQSVWNFGIVAMRPGAANVVPAEAELVVEFRDLDAAVLAAMNDACLAAIKEADGALGVDVKAALIGSLEPAIMDPKLVDVVDRAAAEAKASHVKMPSGAGHDAMITARRMPSAMLFVPSIGGRSHDISENTSDEDIRRGLRVFAAATEKVLTSFT